ncbi:MAG: hypothetical protein KDD06_11245, partial [Phaeodactylibacter sp.]|nr:hypothetical protein [Phaeodactylibacter sp.]
YNGFEGVNNIRLALPSFQRRIYPLHSAQVNYPGGSRPMELVEDLNEVAEQSLRDRFHRELASALVRLAAKEAVEASLRSIKTKKKDKDDEGEKGEKDEKKKDKEDEYSDTAGQILGGAMDIINAVTERADIRSWQSLPAEIYYQRIPLKKGPNEIKICFYNQYHQRMEEYSFFLQGEGGLTVRNVITPDSRVIQPSEKTILP